jgi:hypothetical protein
MIIYDMPTHTKNGKAWVSFPSAPQVENGSVKTLDGKPQYKRLIEWRDRSLSDRFADAAVAVINREKPGVLE